MRFIRLSPTSAELDASFREILGRLAKIDGVRVSSQQVEFLSGDFHIDFEFQGSKFEVATLISTPVISSDDCPQAVFDQLLSQLDQA